MSVMMWLRVVGDPARIEQALTTGPERLKRIGEMGEAGVTERPTPVFWRELDTPDKF